jgi:hypothetical protein
MVVVMASPASAEPPTQPGNRPTPIEGRENGRLPSSELVAVLPGCSVARAAGPSVRLLFADARARGVPLTARDCYRPVGGQVAAQKSATAKGNSACAAQPRSNPDGTVKGTSMHGWGKAVDFGNSGGSLTFSSVGYRYLVDHAARFGWNHPGWARPNGSACPEPWHWEWVGDGGTMGADPLRADVVALVPTASELGYAVVTGLGAVTARGDATTAASVADVPINWVVVGAAATPSGKGTWLVAADGGIFTSGDAVFHGSNGAMRLNAPIIGMASTPDGGGYWLVASDGGIFTFGNAEFFGSTGAKALNRPVVGMAPTPDGKGYWLVASDGGIFTFGDAAFFGSMGGTRLNEPIASMASTRRGGGYWMVASDGGIFTFGDAAFLGSDAGVVRTPVVGMVTTRAGDGYWLVGADGTVFNHGTARHFGSG